MNRALVRLLFAVLGSFLIIGESGKNLNLVGIGGFAVLISPGSGLGWGILFWLENEN